MIFNMAKMMMRVLWFITSALSAMGKEGVPLNVGEQVSWIIKKFINIWGWQYFVCNEIKSSDRFLESFAFYFQIPIGTFFSMSDSNKNYKDEFTAMDYALERQHNDTERLFQFKVFADTIKTVDPYKLTRIICRQVVLTCWILIQFSLHVLLH